MFAQNNGNKTLSGGYETGAVAKPYLSIGVPGTVKGLNYALNKYGTINLKQAIAPAIHLANDGFILQPGDAAIFAKARNDFAKQSNIAKIFLHDNHAYTAGEKLVQKQLAKSLKTIADKGEQGFYQGRIAETVVKAAQANGGVLTMQDFLNYNIEEMPPIRCQYHGYEVISIGPPAAGGVTLCEALSILDSYPLAEMGYHSAQSVHYTVEALRYANADRNHYLGDPNFVDNPTATLISKKKYAKTLRKHILPNQAGDSNNMGKIDVFPEGNHTTSYVIVDRMGNAVSVTYTLNDFFGARVIAGDTGFFLNNELSDFTLQIGKENQYGLLQGKNNLIAKNKRPLSSITPTILTKNNRLAMVMGTPGGSTIPSQILGVIQNSIDYAMNIQQAVDAPRVHMQWQPDKIFIEPYSLSPDTQSLLQKMGYTIQIGSPYGTQYWGGVMAIQVDDQSKELKGAVDARRPTGAALGF